MKIAIIFYGFFRTFDFCKESLKNNVIDPMNCDVFFNSPKTVYTPKKDEISELHNVYSKNEKLIDDEVVNFFGPHLKSHKLRDYDSRPYVDLLNQNGLPLYNNVTKQHTWRTLSYFHSISLSVSLFEEYVKANNVHYDLVILTRADLKYYTVFNPHAVDLNKINCPAHFLLLPEEPQLNHLSDEERQQWPVRQRPGGAGVIGTDRWLNDQIITGSQNNILIYKNLYEKAIEYGKEGICFNQETYLGFHCLKNGLDFTGTDFVTYEIWRQEK